MDVNVSPPSPPLKHYLGHVLVGKEPVILIPGITIKWGFLRKLGDKISMSGHPTYVVPKLGLNFTDISTSAQIVREIINENKLKNVIIVAHSKGGLIGKYLLVNFNQDNRIKKVIAIAAPFSGSPLAKMIPHRSFRELRTTSKIIADLNSQQGVNSRIISIIPTFDNHVWQEANSFLKGAKNIQVNVRGHHKVLFSKEVADKVLSCLTDSGSASE